MEGESSRDWAAALDARRTAGEDVCRICLLTTETGNNPARAPVCRTCYREWAWECGPVVDGVTLLDGAGI